MNVLEVYPAFSWWLCGKSLEEIASVRKLLERSPNEAERSKKAYFLVGDAAAFELLNEVFDEITVRYIPGTLKRLVLERQARRWLTAAGVLRFEPAEELARARQTLPSAAVP